MGTLDKGKFYDAKLIREYCDALKIASNSYGVKATGVQTSYSNFAKDELNQITRASA